MKTFTTTIGSYTSGHGDSSMHIGLGWHGTDGLQEGDELEVTIKVISTKAQRDKELAERRSLEQGPPTALESALGEVAAHAREIMVQHDQTILDEMFGHL